MKMIVAVIRSHRLEEVRKAIAEQGAHGLTVSQVQGYGRQLGHTEAYRGAEYDVDFRPKIRLEIVVPDGITRQVIDALAAAARTGEIGDGKIFTLPVEHALRVRTGEAGDGAL